MSSNRERNKTTSEKPVSLAPLGFKEALAALLKVKPKPKVTDEKADTKPPKRQE